MAARHSNSPSRRYEMKAGQSHRWSANRASHLLESSQPGAVIGHGEEFYASGVDPNEYSAQLMEILGLLSGKRPVALIE